MTRYFLTSPRFTFSEEKKKIISTIQKVKQRKAHHFFLSPSSTTPTPPTTIMSSIINQLGLNTRVPYHFLFYALSFGGTAFYSYIVSPVLFKELSRDDFSKVQGKVFPRYFKYQILSPLLIAAITPFKYCPFTIGTLAIASLSGIFNLCYLEPKCHAIKEERIKLTAIGKEKKDNGEPTDEMQALTTSFGRWHGLSMLINNLSILSWAVYGLTVAKGLTLIKY